MTEIRHERVAIDSIKPFPGNARRGDVEAIRESLRVHGQYKDVVVQESTGYVLAGNHTWEAARAEGWTHIEAGVIDVDDEQAKRINLIDNRTNDLATYDDQALADLLTELPDLEGTGFTDQDLNALLASLGPGGFKQSDLELLIKVPTNPETRLGDRIEMGPHVLWCADYLEAPTLAAHTADMVWTDPPYLVSYQVGLTDKEAKELHRRTDGKEVANDDLTPEQAYSFRLATADSIRCALKPGASFYVFMPPGIDQARWIDAFDASNIAPRQILQWVKDQFVFGRSDYHYRSEPFMYGWSAGSAHRFNGGRTQDSVWEYDRPKRSKDHPTIKPVALAQQAVENSSDPGDTIFDPFAGSGTILMACMQTGRRAAMVELDPAYCDVIVERFERLSGETAIRHRED